MQNPKDENEIGKHILMQYILYWWRCDNKKNMNGAEVR